MIASDLHDYIDDLRNTGPTHEETWEGSTQVAKQSSFLGTQVVGHKKQPGSQQPGAWAGSVSGTSPNRVFVTVTQEHWDKTKREIQRIWEELQGHGSPSNSVLIPYWVVNLAVSFLIYVTQTYPAMRPYLKGIYLTLNSWRPDREDDGWKRVLTCDECEESQVHLDEGAPELISKLLL